MTSPTGGTTIAYTPTKASACRGFQPFLHHGAVWLQRVVLLALIEAQSTHILRILKHARKRQGNYIEVTRDANDRFFGETLRRQGNQIFWQDSCAHANSYYFDKNGDVQLRPTTTLESAIRSGRFNVADYIVKRVGTAPAALTPPRRRTPAGQPLASNVNAL